LRHLAGVEVLHWHADTFDVPDQAQILASTEVTPHQAFSWDRNLGIQFHPEVDGHEIERWLIGHSGELIEAGVDVSALRAKSKELADASATAGVALIRDYLKAIKS